MVDNMASLRAIPKHRRIRIHGYIKSRTADRVVRRLRELSRNSKKPVLLDLRVKTGGDPEPMVEIVRAIKKAQDKKVPVYAVVSDARSAGFVILQACDLRVGRPNSTYRMHLTRAKIELFSFFHPDIERWMKNVRQVAEVLWPVGMARWNEEARDDLVTRAKEAGRTEEELLEFLLLQKLMSAEEALEWGFLDGIMGVG